MSLSWSCRFSLSTISHFAQKSTNSSTGRQQLLQVSALISKPRVTFAIFNEEVLPFVTTSASNFFLWSCAPLTTASCFTGHSLAKQLMGNRQYRTELVERHQYYGGNTKKKSIHLEIGPVLTNRYQNTSTILYHTSGWEVWGGPSGNLHVSGWNSPTLDTIEKYIESILLSSSSSTEQTVKRQRPIVEKKKKKGPKNMYRC